MNIEQRLRQLRDNLLQLEEYRDRQHDVLWDAQMWQTTFDAITSHECERDAVYQHQIDTAYQQRSYTQLPVINHQWCRALDDDVRWYATLDKRVRLTHDRWLHDAAIGPEQMRLVREHLRQIDRRWRKCGLLTQQTQIVYLEQVRWQNGTVDTGKWHRTWSNLLKAFDHDAELYGEILPQNIVAERLCWLNDLLQLQHSTAQHWHGKPFDHAALAAAMNQVEAAKAQLLPPPAARPIPWMRWLKAAGIAGLAATVAMGWAARNRGDTPAPTVVAVLPTLERATLAPTTTGALTLTEPPTLEPAATLTEVSGGIVDAASLNDQGLALLQQNNCTAAMPLFREAILIDSTWSEPHDNLAFCLYETGTFAEAETAWREAIRLHPESADAHAGLGMLLYRQGQPAAGIGLYRTAVSREAHYLDEQWLRDVALWSEQAISDSRPLREQIR